MAWLRSTFGDTNYIDLLDDEVYLRLSAQSKAITDYITNPKAPIIIDEVQKLPKLLDEVHRLIESKKYKFILTGSSSRKLKKSGVNLLAGRALVYNFHTLTSTEMGDQFNLFNALKFGMLPQAQSSETPTKFLASYVTTYIREEIQQERLVRNIPAFTRFLQAASFSQASPLNVSNVAKECQVERKVVEDYFQILQDLMLSFELPVFSKRAKRDLIKKSKFFFFDCGVFRTIRPKGPLDSDSEMNGLALETLVVQTIRTLNDLLSLEYELSYWHTKNKIEVDLVLYGPKGLTAFEIKSSSRLSDSDFYGLREFAKDYPMSKKYLLYSGKERKEIFGVSVIPLNDFFDDPKKFL